MNNVIYFGNYEGYNHNSDLLLYILSCWTENIYCNSHKVGVHTMLGCLFKNGRPFPEYYPTVQKRLDVGASRYI